MTTVLFVVDRRFPREANMIIEPEVCRWNPCRWAAFAALLLVADYVAVGADQPVTQNSVLVGRDFTLPVNAQAFLRARREQEIEAAKRFRAFHDFQFTDRYKESG